MNTPLTLLQINSIVKSCRTNNQDAKRYEMAKSRSPVYCVLLWSRVHLLAAPFFSSSSSAIWMSTWNTSTNFFTLLFLLRFPFSFSFACFVVSKRLKIRAAGQHMFSSLTLTHTRTYTYVFCKTAFASWLLLLATACGVDLKINIAKIRQHTHTHAHTKTRATSQQKERKWFPRRSFKVGPFFNPLIYTFVSFLLSTSLLWCLHILLRAFIASFRLFVWQFEWNFNFSPHSILPTFLTFQFSRIFA